MDIPALSMPLAAALGRVTSNDRLNPPRAAQNRHCHGSMHERIVNGELRIANGGVGVYIYHLIQHWLTVDPSTEYFLIRSVVAFLDVYQIPAHTTSSMPARKIHRALALLGGPYSRRVREFNLDLIHFPNLFGGSSLPVSIRQVVTLQDLTPLLFPSMHPRHRVWASRIQTRRR